MQTEIDSAYFFDLRMVCGGYAYFVTHTVFNSFAKGGREVRDPDTVDFKLFNDAVKLLGQKIFLIQSVKGYGKWLYSRGWALVDKNFARSNMQKWLKSAVCIKAPTGIFTNIEIVSPSALKHYTSKGRKKNVLSRDKETCLMCGLKESNGVRLTMQHVRPYSKGGETTSQNLVTLCETCNFKLGNDEEIGLYNKAGLHFDYDPSIIGGRLSTESRNKALELSDNLMQTRCEIW